MDKVKNLNEKYKRNTNLLFYCFSIFIFTIIVWSFVFQVDIVSNAEGQIIPVGEVKTIQHLEGGIIETILVKESEVVEKDQPLVVLAATASEVDVEELQVRIDSQIIKSIRLEAEINNFDVPVFSDELVNNRPELINKSLELFVSRKDKLEGDIKEVADALTDILYVTYGAGHAFGINLDKCFEEVQNSNMSKLGDDGKPIYNDKGKVMKGPNYFKPNLSKFVA